MVKLGPKVKGRMPKKGTLKEEYKIKRWVRTQNKREIRNRRHSSLWI